MTLQDNEFLKSQFRVKVYKKTGTEFQSFFEDIMEKVYPDFQKIRPYGKKGDGGNDGYRKNSGIYYQVYAPLNPAEKEASGAKKLKNDFAKLKEKWSDISIIREHCFVFNDKYRGSVKMLEAANTELEKCNEGVVFKLFLARNLEDEFKKLDDSDLTELGFNVGIRQSIDILYSFIETANKELDKNNLAGSKEIIDEIKRHLVQKNEDKLSLEHELLLCRYLYKSEKVEESLKKYISITKRYPQDIRSYLFIASIYLTKDDRDQNLQYIKKAENIDPGHYLVEIALIERKIVFSEEITLSNVDETSFPEDEYKKAEMYRRYTHLFLYLHDESNAQKYLENSITLNKNSVLIQLTKLKLEMDDWFNSENGADSALVILNEIKAYEESNLDSLRNRDKSTLNEYKSYLFHSLARIMEFEKTAKKTINECMLCYFDSDIDGRLVAITKLVKYSSIALKDISEYLQKSVNTPSANLLNALFIQFLMHDKLSNEGRSFYENINNKYLQLIDDIENYSISSVINIIDGKNDFGADLALNLSWGSDEKIRIIDQLSINDEQKKQLLIYIYIGSNDYNSAFNIAKNIDLNEKHYLVLHQYLDIFKKKEAWEYVIKLSNYLLNNERDPSTIFEYKHELFNSYLELKKFKDVIVIGRELLDSKILSKQSDELKELLFYNTLFAYLERKKVDLNVLKDAIALIEESELKNYRFDFKVGVVSKIYLENNLPRNALEIIFEAIRDLQNITSKEYFNLYYHFIEIANRIQIEKKKLAIIEDGCFFKIDEESQWYYIGEDRLLDAKHIAHDSSAYSIFIGQIKGGEVEISGEYTGEIRYGKIAEILPFEEYILYQSQYYFYQAANDFSNDTVQAVSIVDNDGVITKENLIKYFDHEYEGQNEFFDYYCNNTIPLAFLATKWGSIAGAIGAIQNNKRGFIHITSGVNEEIENQLISARRCFKQQTIFYIDMSSILFLVETGVFSRIFTLFPKLRIPQSVVTALIAIIDKCEYRPGMDLQMQVSQGNISVYEVEKYVRESLKEKIADCISLIESDPDKVALLSSAMKDSESTEVRILPEMCDACVLAQEEGAAVLTDDYLYLHANHIDTGKDIPEYFSSLALVRMLYEENKVPFSEYMNYMSYLSSYRCKFISLLPDYLEKSVFGDDTIIRVSTDEIRGLNLKLLLSEEYGVDFQLAFHYVGRFVLKIFDDHSVTTDIMKGIALELIESLPDNFDKKRVSYLFHKVCERSIKSIESETIVILSDNRLSRKLNGLKEIVEIYNGNRIIHDLT